MLLWFWKRKDWQGANKYEYNIQKQTDNIFETDTNTERVIYIYLKYIKIKIVRKYYGQVQTKNNNMVVSWMESNASNITYYKITIYKTQGY